LSSRQLKMEIKQNRLRWILIRFLIRLFSKQYTFVSFCTVGGLELNSLFEASCVTKFLT